MKNRLAAFRALVDDLPAFFRALAPGVVIYVIVGEAILTALGM